MKRCQSLLICISQCSAPVPIVRLTSAAAHASSAVTSATATAVDFSAATALSAGRLMSPWTTQANFADFSGDVVKDMRATSAFVQEQAAKAGTPTVGWSRWLHLG